MIENLPCCPSPEINVKVTKMLGVSAYAPIARRHPRAQRCWFFRVLACSLYPAAKPFGFYFVWRIADDDCDCLFALDLVGFLARLRNRSEDAGNPPFVVIQE